MFDEVDKSSLLNYACEFIDYSKNVSCIDSIHLITATAYNSFWKKIKKLGITQLKNLRYEISEMLTAEELINSYRKIQDHKKIYVESDSESEDFIKDIYDRYIPKNEYPLRLFAPPFFIFNIPHYSIS